MSAALVAMTASWRVRGGACQTEENHMCHGFVEMLMPETHMHGEIRLLGTVTHSLAHL